MDTGLIGIWNNSNGKAEELSHQMIQHEAIGNNSEENWQSKQQQSNVFYCVQNETNYAQAILENQSKSSKYLDFEIDETANVIPYETASIFLKRINNNLCFERTDKQADRKLIGLIDMGIKNNFISRKNVKHGKILELKKSITIKTVQGQSKVSCYVKVNIFSHDLIFLIVDTLDKFDFLLGFVGLRKINASIDFLSLKLIFNKKIEKKVDICPSLSRLNKRKKNQNNIVQKEKNEEENIVNEIEKTKTEKINVCDKKCK